MRECVISMYIIMQCLFHLFHMEQMKETLHDDVRPWNRVSHNWPFERGIHWWLFYFTRKRQYCGALILGEADKPTAVPTVWEDVTFTWRHSNANDLTVFHLQSRTYSSSLYFAADVVCHFSSSSVTTTTPRLHIAEYVPLAARPGDPERCGTCPVPSIDTSSAERQPSSVWHLNREGFVGQPSKK